MKLIPTTRVDYDDLTHSYLLDGEFYLMGVTSLMKKHGLSPNYSNLNPAVLEKAAERGTKGHKWIEEYCKKGKRANSKIIKEFKKFNLKVLKNEFLISDEQIVASMIDIILEDYSIIDIKFTSQLHTKAVQWQLSIYAYLLEWYYGIKVPKLYALHYNKENEASLIEIDRLPNAQVLELFQAEREGRIYEELPTPTASSDKAVMELWNITNYIDGLKKQIKEAEERQKALQDAFLEKMEESGTKSIVTDFCKITYVAASTREGVDSKLLKAEKPELFEQYKKITTVKPSVRITITKQDV